MRLPALRNTDISLATASGGACNAGRSPPVFRPRLSPPFVPLSQSYAIFRDSRGAREREREGGWRERHKREGMQSSYQSPTCVLFVSILCLFDVHFVFL